MTPKPISILPKEREIVRTDGSVQLEISEALGLSIQTIYQWALYHPERLAKRKAAMDIIHKHLKKQLA